MLDFDFSSANSGSECECENRHFICATKKSIKMNIDKLPLVTTLLRASRSQDDETLRHTLENILRNGMSEAELNAQDCSGRVSVLAIYKIPFIRFIFCLKM